MIRIHRRVRMMAIAALAAILALGLYGPTSVPQQQEEEPIVIYAALCFVPGPVYSLSALLQANGVSVEGATVVKEEGNVVKVHTNQLIETIALGPGKITVSGPVQAGQTPPVVSQGITDGNGFFIFTVPVAGNYRISEELRPGWQPTTAPFVTVGVVERADPKGLIVPATVIPFLPGPGRPETELVAFFGNKPGVSIGFFIGPSGSCQAPTTGLAISVQINRIEATLKNCKTGEPIPEGTPAAFVLNPKPGVEEIRSAADTESITVYAEGYHPATVKNFQVLTVGFGPLAVRVIFLGTICLEPLD